jgi:hypothetical protein
MSPRDTANIKDTIPPNWVFKDLNQATFFAIFPS